MLALKCQVALGFLAVALVAPICLFDWTQAQKTISHHVQQQVEATGSNPNSVYGGYQQSSSSFNQQRQQSYIAPVNRPARFRQQSYKRAQSVSRPVIEQQQLSSSNYEEFSQNSAEADSEPASVGSVNGQAGVDYPSYTRVPKTSFSCEGLPYEYGMYADEEAQCQAYHVCYNGRKDSFLCGPGTVFNQRILHCDYWYSVDCGKSSLYYSSNAYMGSSKPEPGPAQASLG